MKPRQCVCQMGDFEKYLAIRCPDIPHNRKILQCARNNEINSGRCQRRPTPQQSNRCEAVTVSRKQTTSLVLFAVSILPSCVGHLQSYPSTIMSTQTTGADNSERCIPAMIKEATHSSDEVGGCTVQGCQCPMFKRAPGSDNCSTRNCGHHYNHRKFLHPEFHAKAN